MQLVLKFMVLLLLSATNAAAERLPLGTFQIINSAGFEDKDGQRTPLPPDTETGTVSVRQNGSDDLLLSINGSDLKLYRIDNGLAALAWNSDGSFLLDYADILDLSTKLSAEDIPAWGAEIFWPGLGKVRMVILPLRENAYTGFLISRPSGNLIVRQMELRKLTGPLNRPGPASPTTGTFSGEPAIN